MYYLIHTAQDGPVAAAYRQDIADRAAQSLRTCTPGQRVWITKTDPINARNYDVEPLLTLADTRIRELWQTTIQNGQEDTRRLRDTLAGLIPRPGISNGRTAAAQAFNALDAQRRARDAWNASQKPGFIPPHEFTLDQITTSQRH